MGGLARFARCSKFQVQSSKFSVGACLSIQKSHGPVQSPLPLGEGEGEGDSKVGSITLTRRKRVILVSLLLSFCLSAFSSYAAESDAILAGAQKEGELTTWAVGEIPFQTMVVDRFKKKYPFMKKVDAVRIPSEKLRTRLITEAQTGKSSNVDILGVGGFELIYLLDKGFFSVYRSPEANAMPAGYKDPNGRWAAYYVNTAAAAYNTRMVARTRRSAKVGRLIGAKMEGQDRLFRRRV